MLRLIRGGANALEKALAWFGASCGWAAILLMLVILAQVTMRYVFGKPIVALSELEWHLYAALVMFSIPYASIHNAQVKVDILHERFPEKVKRGIGVFSLLCLVIPLSLIIFFDSFQFARDAFLLGEKSPIAGGLSYRWIVKGLIPFGTVLICTVSMVKIIQLFLRPDEKE